MRGLSGSLVVLVGLFLTLVGMFHLVEMNQKLLGTDLSEARVADLLQFLVLPFQLAVGVGLVCFPRKLWFQISGVLLLLVFGVFNLVSWLLSSPPCSCIPTMVISHPKMLTLDALLAAPLAIAVIKGGRDLRSVTSSFHVAVVGLAVMVISLMSCGLDVVAASRHGLKVVSESTRVTAVSSDEAVRLDVMVVNETGGEVVVFGANSSCRCTLIEGLPLRVPSGQYRSMPVSVKLSKNERALAVPVVLLTDSKDTPRIEFDINVEFLSNR